MGTGHEVCRRPPHEHPCGRVAQEDGKSRPLEQFAQIVGTGHIVEHASLGQVVVGVARLAQVAYGVVSLHVGVHSQEEEHNAHPEVPVLGIVAEVGVGVLGEEHYACAKQGTVHGIEPCTHGNDGQGHAALALQQGGEDETTVHIVQGVESHEEKLQTVGREHHVCHYDGHEGGSLHQYPTNLVVYTISPSVGAELAIAGIHEVQGYEHEQAHDGHYP